MSLKNRYFVNEKEVGIAYFSMMAIMKEKCESTSNCEEIDEYNNYKECELKKICAGMDGIPLKINLRVESEEEIKKRGFEVVEDKHRKHPDVEIKIPQRGTKNSAGYDICTPVKIVIPPHGISEAIQTDIKAYMLEDEALEIYPRSSLGFKKGLMLINTVGIIDSDYYSNKDNDGNIGFKLKNLTDKEVTVEAGEKIMQGIFKKYLKADDDNVNEERIGGIGSTGK